MKKPEVYLVTGPVNSGKTTRLTNWVKTKSHCAGILTPKIEGRRMFLDIKTGEHFPMEANETESALHVGKYLFSAAAFEKAITFLRQASADPTTEWLVLDEIGPLELKGEGFSKVLKDILAEEKIINIVLVVRQGLESDVLNHFDIKTFNQLDSALRNA